MIEKLQAQIEILEFLQHTTAYTGDLSNLQQKSYVLYSDVIDLINELRREIKNQTK